MMKQALLIAAIATVPVIAFAQDGIEVKDAYARATNAMSGGIFMSIENRGTQDCKLTEVSSDAAERVMLHTSMEVDGVMKMTHLKDGITVKAGGEHSLARGGDHIMLMGLTQKPEDGQSIALTLDFGDCGQKQVELPIDNKR